MPHSRRPTPTENKQTVGSTNDYAILDWRECPEGTWVPVRAHPGGRRNAICGTHGGQLKVTVVATPEGGKANRAIVRLMAQQLGIPPSAIQLRSGATSRNKVFLLMGVTRRQAIERFGLDQLA